MKQLSIAAFCLLFSSFALADQSCSADGDPGCGITCTGATEVAQCFDGLEGYTDPDTGNYRPGTPGQCQCTNTQGANPLIEGWYYGQNWRMEDGNAICNQTISKTTGTTLSETTQCPKSFTRPCTQQPDKSFKCPSNEGNAKIVVTGPLNYDFYCYEDGCGGDRHPYHMEFYSKTGRGIDPRK